MDLKSMLNDAAAQRPSVLHTTHSSSYDSRTADNSATPESRSQSRSQSQSNRPLPFPPPLQPVDSRAPSAGGYFGFPSPHQNNLNSASTHASTPSVGPHSAYAHSPGSQSQSQSQTYTPRNSAGPPGPHNPSFVPSPSLSVNHPPTPGSAHPYQTPTPLSAHSQVGHPLPYAQAQAHSPRASHSTNGQPRQISPRAQHNQLQPATPLGPPKNYHKISPQAQRPLSQGVDHHQRRSSHGSVGSVQSKDHNLGQPLPHTELVRSESVQRQTVLDLDRLKERERSLSVSPKTIPQPSPYRQASVSSQAGSQGRLSVQSPGDHQTRAISGVSDITVTSHPAAAEVKLEHQYTPTPKPSALPIEQQTLSRGPSIKRETPEATSSPAVPMNLKRNASVMSDYSHSSQQQSRKRLRRDETPIFAQSARKKALRLGAGAQKQRPAKATNRPTPAPAPSQPQPHQRPTKAGSVAIPNGKGTVPEPTPGSTAEVKWESSIANIAPYEDLTRRVCDWIFQTIGTATPPAGGAMFEIEAKIGEIFDTNTGARIILPVDTEAVFNKSRWSRTKFESSMNMEQHMLLNKYLNELTQEAFVQAQRGERQEILYDHPHEVDEFFELTNDGKQNLNSSIQQYLNPTHKPRVRRTKDRNTGQLKAQIIKSRIADLEIYNPNTDFDCRISISIESPWEGNPDWLVSMSDGFEGRHKDRMSYRHMAYQIDLTQVSHDNQPNMEHELEVEISTEQVRRELDNLQNGRESKYEDLVRGLLDNVRLLCRKGSIGTRRI